MPTQYKFMIIGYTAKCVVYLCELHDVIHLFKLNRKQEISVLIAKQYLSKQINKNSFSF